MGRTPLSRDWIRLEADAYILVRCHGTHGVIKRRISGEVALDSVALLIGILGRAQALDDRVDILAGVLHGD